MAQVDAITDLHDVHKALQVRIGEEEEEDRLIEQRCRGSDRMETAPERRKSSPRRERWTTSSNSCSRGEASSNKGSAR